MPYSINLETTEGDLISLFKTLSSCLINLNISICLLVNPVSSSTSSLTSSEEDILPEDIERFEGLSYEERHKNLVEANTRYIWDQMSRSIQHFTQEMLHQIREQQKEDERNERS